MDYRMELVATSENAEHVPSQNRRSPTTLLKTDKKIVWIPKGTLWLPQKMQNKYLPTRGDHQLLLQQMRQSITKNCTIITV